MRVLFWFLLLACAAVAIALAARLTTGYALFVAPPYRVELSLNLLLPLVAGGFIAGYVLLRIVRRALGLPEEVRLYRQRQHQERARAKQDAALVAMLEGRFGRARQFAEEALAIPQSSGLSTKSLWIKHVLWPRHRLRLGHRKESRPGWSAHAGGAAAHS